MYPRYRNPVNENKRLTVPIIKRFIPININNHTFSLIYYVLHNLFIVYYNLLNKGI